MKRYNLAMICPDPTDPTSFYRGMGWYNHLRKLQPIDLVNSGQYNWPIIGACDVVFMQRPFLPEYLKIAQMVKEAGIPLIIDYDDYLFDLKHDNPTYAKYMSASIQSCVTELCSLADVITVSTNNLKKALQNRKIESRIEVIPNSYDQSLFKYATNYKKRNPYILFRGSTSNVMNLSFYKKAILENVKKFPDYKFLFLNIHPWFLYDSCTIEDKNVMFMPGLPIKEYFSSIYHMAPKVMYHTLMNHIFDLCRSHCSWLESTHARAAFLGPNFDEFDRCGITAYDIRTPDSFATELGNLISKPEDEIEHLWKMSQQEITEKYTLDIVNKKRWDIMNEFLS